MPTGKQPIGKPRGGKSDASGSQSRLTPQQAKVLNFIEKELSASGRPPSLREIARHFGFTAVSSVESHIQALVKKGFLEKDRGAHHGLRLSYHSEAQSVPVLGFVPAGSPVEAIEESSGSLPVPARYKGEIFALQVTGQSMKDAGILDGDYVIVRKQNTAESGEIVVATIDGEATVKTLEKKKGRIRLLPANDDYAPIELDSSQENLIQGKVISVQRYL